MLARWLAKIKDFLRRLFFMLDFNYNGVTYTLVKNTALFKCVNVLFMGIIFIENKRYKKYVNANSKIYLLEY
jgi:hypothetical protein